LTNTILTIILGAIWVVIERSLLFMTTFGKNVNNPIYMIMRA